MAIEEHDREDMLRDGKKMPMRGEIKINGETVVIGFRIEGQLSIYCGADPVFQFNQRHQVRRMYFQGRRYAAEKGKLVELIRESKGGRVAFERRCVPAEELAAMNAVLSRWIERIQQSLESPLEAWRLCVDTSVSEDDREFVVNLRDALRKIARPPLIAESANA